MRTRDGGERIRLTQLNGVGREQLLDFGDEGFAGRDPVAVAEQENRLAAVVQSRDAGR